VIALLPPRHCYCRPGSCWGAQTCTRSTGTGCRTGTPRGPGPPYASCPPGWRAKTSSLCARTHTRRQKTEAWLDSGRGNGATASTSGARLLQRGTCGAHSEKLALRHVPEQVPTRSVCVSRCLQRGALQGCAPPTRGAWFKLLRGARRLPRPPVPSGFALQFGAKTFFFADPSEFRFVSEMA